MNKSMLGISVLALIFMLGSGAMAGSSAPKNLCYQWDGFVPVALMNIKSMGNLKTADGAVKQYAINGTHDFSGYQVAHLTGSATFANDTLNFSHTCIARYPGGPGTPPTDYLHLLSEGTFNTASGTGALTYTYITLPDDTGTVTIFRRNTITITGISCADYSVSPLTTGTIMSTSEDGQR